MRASQRWLSARLLRVGMALALAAVLGVLVLLIAGEWFSRSARHPVGPPPAALVGAEAVTMASTPGQSVRGWFAPGRPGGGAVLLLHGIRGDRTAMLPRALALQRAGHAVLLVDLPAHGESSGERISFGLHEADGVRAALAWLRGRAIGEKLGVVAVSLGAVATVLAQPRPAPDALVLESMFPTLEDAVTDRIAARLGRPLARLTAPLLLWQLPLRLGMHADQLRPLDHMATLNTPLLLAAGTEDAHTPWAETQHLFAAARQPKTLWGVPGAGHVDLHTFNVRAYETAVLPFLAGYLQARP